MTTKLSLNRQVKKNNKLSITNGGRSLNAIWNLPFTTNEKIILQYIGSQLDFRADFLEWRQISQNLIASKTGLSRRTVIRVMLKLESKGYLQAVSNKQNASHYRLTTKLFDRYEIWLNARDSRLAAKAARNTPCDRESQPKLTPCDRESQPKLTPCDRESQGVCPTVTGGVTQSHNNTPSPPPSPTPSYILGQKPVDNSKPHQLDVGAKSKKITKSFLVGKIQTHFKYATREQANALVTSMMRDGHNAEKILEVFDARLEGEYKNLSPRAFDFLIQAARAG